MADPFGEIDVLLGQLAAIRAKRAKTAAASPSVWRRALAFVILAIVGCVANCVAQQRSVAAQSQLRVAQRQLETAQAEAGCAAGEPVACNALLGHGRAAVLLEFRRCRLYEQRPPFVEEVEAWRTLLGNRKKRQQPLSEQDRSDLRGGIEAYKTLTTLYSRKDVAPEERKQRDHACFMARHQSAGLESQAIINLYDDMLDEEDAERVP